MENYHSDFREMSSTALKKFIHSGKHYQQYIEDAKNGERFDTEPMKIGRVFHSFMEGVENNYALFDVENRPEKDKGITSKINQAWKKEVMASHENVITLEQLNEIKEMVEEVKKSTFYKLINQAFTKVGNETTFKAELKGLPCKCKIDQLHDDGENIVVIDWKKTNESLTKNLYQYQRIIERLNYDVSMVHYSEILKAIFNRPVTFIFVFVEDKKPFDLMPVYVSSESQYYNDNAKIKWTNLMLRAKFAIENNIFEGVTGVGYELANEPEKTKLEIIKNFSHITL